MAKQGRDDEDTCRMPVLEGQWRAPAALTALLGVGLRSFCSKVLQVMQLMQQHLETAAEKLQHLERRVDALWSTIGDSSRHLQQALEEHDLERAPAAFPWLRLERCCRALFEGWCSARGAQGLQPALQLQTWQMLGACRGRWSWSCSTWSASSRTCWRP